MRAPDRKIRTWLGAGAALVVLLLAILLLLKPSFLRSSKPGPASPRARTSRRGDLRSSPGVDPRVLARLRPNIRRLYGRISTPGGAPVGGATVRLMFAGGADVLTRSLADGRYSALFAPARADRLEVSARGYRTKIFDRPKFPVARQIRWDVVLHPARGIHGRVLAAGRPVRGAYVWMVPRGSRRAVGRARSDSQGRFAFQPRGATPWRITAYHAQHGRAEVEVDGPGEVTIHLPGGGFATGKVSDSAGRPIRDFQVSITGYSRGSGGPGAQSFESADGTFKLGPVAAGTRTVYAVAPGYQPGRVRGVKIIGGQTTGGVKIVLQGSATLKGRVTDAQTGQPIEGASVAPAEWRIGALSRAAGAFTDSQGYYTLRSLPGPRTSVQVRARGYLSLLGGGVSSAPGQTLQRDFALTPQPPGHRGGRQLTGIGAVLSKRAGGVQVVRVIQGGPAATALQAGDVVVMVGETDASRAGFREIIQAIRGEVDTDVVLWVRRGGAGDPVRVLLTRRRVTMPGRR